MAPTGARAVWSLLVLGALTAGCGALSDDRPVYDARQNDPVVPPPTSSTSPTPSARPVGPAAPAAARPPSPSASGAASYLARGQDGPTCLNGWVTPRVGTPLSDEGLEALVAAQPGLGSTPVARDLRVFVGPDAPGAQPAESSVSRWYVAVADGPLAGRYLVEKRRTGTRVAAVAPPSTVGWRSPDWSRVGGDGPPTARPGVPGEWPGPAVDAVATRRRPASGLGGRDGA